MLAPQPEETLALLRAVPAQALQTVEPEIPLPGEMEILEAAMPDSGRLPETAAEIPPSP